MTFVSELKEAKSAYLSSLRLDDSNMTVLRDLATVQHNLGDWTGFAESRRKYMLKNPQIVNWCSFLWGLYKAEDFDNALQCLDSTLEVVA